MAAASSGSHLSPLDSSFSLLYNSSSLVSVAYSALGAVGRYNQWHVQWSSELIVGQVSAEKRGYGHSHMTQEKGYHERKQRILTFNNGIDRAALLAVSTVDALGHINIVSGGSSASIFTLLGFNGDGLRRANGLTELASNAALLTGWVAAEGVFTTESWGDRALLEGVENRVSGHHTVISAPLHSPDIATD